MLIDKENNANHANLNFRRRRTIKDNKFGHQTILEATFRPLPKINQVSIPLLPIRLTVNTPDDSVGQRVSKGKQGPVIAKSHKLKSFFGEPSQRYDSRRKMTLNPREMIRHSVESIRSKKSAKPDTPISAKTIEVSSSPAR
jgi:hypothetical protein